MSSARSSAEPSGHSGRARPRELGGDLGAGVLLVEDDRGYAALVRAMVEESSLAELGFDHVERLGPARDYVLRAGAGCVLLDLSLPDAHQLEAVKSLRAAVPDVPIVVLTGLEDDGLAAEAVAAGAQDYLVKGHLDAYHLAHAVRFAVERQRRESALARERERELADDLLHDPLTGLPTFVLFDGRLQGAISRAERNQSFFGLLLLDVDGLGDINREHGRAIGDAVVSELKRRCSTMCPWDSIMRDGGRLLVLCEDLEGPTDAVTLARLVGADLRETGFELNGRDFSARVRIGVASGAASTTPEVLAEEVEGSLGRVTDHWPPPPAEGTRVLGPERKTQLEVLRKEIDAGLDYGLSLAEIELLLDGKVLSEEIRDAAWLYAWAVLEASARRRPADLVHLRKRP